MGHCNTCNSHGPVVMYVAKLFPKPDCSSFDAFARVFSGSVKAGDNVRVLGQSYTPDDEEDSAVAQVSKVWVFMGRYRIPVTKAMAGVVIPFCSAFSLRLPFSAIRCDTLPKGQLIISLLVIMPLIGQSMLCNA